MTQAAPGAQRHPILPSQRSRATRDKTNWLTALAFAIGGGAAVVILLGMSNEAFGEVRAVMSGLFVAGAAAVVGGFLGFLFGIPRAQQVTPSPQDRDSARAYLENTNLEQISDWLTKIIVGLTLVQFPQISAMLATIGEAVGPTLIQADAPFSQAFGVALVLYFLTIGFLFAYLWTRVYMETVLRMQNALSERDLRAVLEAQEAEQNELREVTELVIAYLEPGADLKDPEFDGLAKKVREASSITRTLVFEITRKALDDALRPGGAPDAVERLIPILKALIDAEPDKYHRNYAKLGRALMAKRRPDWHAAQRYLKTAIEMRGPGPSASLGHYEYELARARVNLDDEKGTANPSAPDEAREITELLDTARKARPLAGDPEIEAWAARNGYAI